MALDVATRQPRRPAAHDRRVPGLSTDRATIHELEPRSMSRCPQIEPPIRIGNGAGFWGDNLDAPYLLARDGTARRLDARVPRRADDGDPRPSAGRRTRRPAMSPTFPSWSSGSCPILREQPALRIVTNAGGLEPAVVRRRVRRDPASRRGWASSPIGVVTGDDVLDRESRAGSRTGLTLDHLETGEPISSVADRLVERQCLPGARPIAEASQAAPGSWSPAGWPTRR